MKKTIALPLIALAGILAGCSETTGSSTSSSNVEESSDSSSSGSDIEVEASSTLGEIGKLRTSQGTSAMPSLGTAKLLVVPVEFTPEPFDEEELREYGYDEETIQYLLSFFTESFSEDDLENIDDVHFGERNRFVKPSAYQFYDASSFGKFHLEGETAEPVVLNETFTEIINGISQNGATWIYRNIYEEVVDRLFGEDGPYKVEDFDSNLDGKVDGLTLAYCYPTTYVYYYYTLLQNSAWVSAASNILTVGIMPDSILPEEIGSAYWMSGNVSSITNGEELVPNDAYVEVAMHLGLDSMADTTGDLEGNARLPLGFTDLMDGGYLDLNPFSKYTLGWIEPTVVTLDDLANGALEFDLASAASQDSVLLLQPEETGIYGEYLLVDYFNAEDGYHRFDAASTLDESGVRIYKVDARLVRGTVIGYALYDGNPDYDATYTLSNGSEAKYSYDFAYSNNGTNDYAGYGIQNNFPLCTILVRDGSNRHMANQIQVTGDDLFRTGDVFGSDSGIPGFYQGYTFNGNGYDGPELGMEIEIGNVGTSGAHITVRRAN